MGGGSTRLAKENLHDDDEHVAGNQRQLEVGRGLQQTDDLVLHGVVVLADVCGGEIVWEYGGQGRQLDTHPGPGEGARKTYMSSKSAWG